MSKDTQLDMVREAANRPPYKQDVYVNAGQLLEEIEREYLPRPRFEDGEPVKEGDTICIDDHLPLKVHSWSIRNDGLTVFSCPTSHRSIKTGDCVKRPEPEVLDADGVPIIVGDVVYFVDSAEAFDVLGIESDGDEPVHIGRKDRTSTDAWISPGDLTHKQPDSLERIEADAEKTTRDYWECYETDCCSCPARSDGKNPRERFGAGRCQTAMTLDLLYRQRVVLERDHER